MAADNGAKSVDSPCSPRTIISRGSRAARMLSEEDTSLIRFHNVESTWHTQFFVTHTVLAVAGHWNTSSFYYLHNTIHIGAALKCFWLYLFALLQHLQPFA